MKCVCARVFTLLVLLVNQQTLLVFNLKFECSLKVENVGNGGEGP